MKTILRGFAKRILSIPAVERFVSRFVFRQFQVKGVRNKVFLRRPWTHKKIQVFIAGNDNFVSIDGSSMGVQVQIEGSGNRILIEPGCVLHWTKIHIVGDDCAVTIGSHSSFNGTASKMNLLLARDSPTYISIGQDCIFAYGIELRTSDSHKLVNSLGDIINPPSDISISDHVWIAANCTVLKGSRVGRDSVLAANSVTSGQVPESSLVGGVPARIIRSGISWIR